MKSRSLLDWYRILQRPPPLDSVPSDSVCAVAGSLDTFTNPISARRTQ